jgi:hypothetical protein
MNKKAREDAGKPPAHPRKTARLSQLAYPVKRQGYLSDDFPCVNAGAFRQDLVKT